MFCGTGWQNQGYAWYIVPWTYTEKVGLIDWRHTLLKQILNKYRINIEIEKKLFFDCEKKVREKKRRNKGKNPRVGNLKIVFKIILRYIRLSPQLLHPNFSIGKRIIIINMKCGCH